MRTAATARRYLAVALVLVVLAALLLWAGYRSARADPIVRRAAFALPDWPAGEPPITVALLSDIHMESAAMDEARLARIVAQVNALRPDLVVIAGDFIEGFDATEAAHAGPIIARQLRGFAAPLGTVGVLGNHDYWTHAPTVVRSLARAGVLLLDNDAARIGPLAIGGLDDWSTGHARIDLVESALARLTSAGVLIAHSPVIGNAGPRIRLVLAGHTHCGQVVLPLIGAPVEVTASRYRCGIIRDPGRITIVTAGLGTSNLPLRFGAPPDLWLIRLGPQRR